MPPSDNRMHRTGSRSYHRYSSKEFEDYKKNMRAWAYQNLKALREARECVKAMVKPTLSLDLYFEKSRLYTQKKTLKKIDTGNFLKAAQDTLCELLRIDDHVFWEVSLRRHISPNSHSFVDIEIKDANAYWDENK